jgi:hypothetical protein
MATLQEVHYTVQQLYFRQRERKIAIDNIVEQLNISSDDIVTKLSQLADLNYVLFSCSKDHIILTETGILTAPLIGDPASGQSSVMQ